MGDVEFTEIKAIRANDNGNYDRIQNALLMRREWLDDDEIVFGYAMPETSDDVLNIFMDLNSSIENSFTIDENGIYICNNCEEE